MKEYKQYWKRAFHFRGVASRTEFWIPVAINFVVTIILNIISQIVLGWDIGQYSLSDIWFFITLVPTISNGVRRLHDTGRSGLWYLLGLVPLAGFVVIAFFVMDTDFLKSASHRAYNREMGWDVKYPEKDAQYWKYYDESSFYQAEAIETTGEVVDEER